MSPHVLERDAVHLELGAKKYGERNWEKGQPLSRYMDSALRHLYRYLSGYRDEDHLAAARWNIGALMHTDHQVSLGNLPKSLQDLPNREPVAEFSSTEDLYGEDFGDCCDDLDSILRRLKKNDD
jgi:hypothetical protein